MKQITLPAPSCYHSQSLWRAQACERIIAQKLRYVHASVYLNVLTGEQLDEHDRDKVMRLLCDLGLTNATVILAPPTINRSPSLGNDRIRLELRRRGVRKQFPFVSVGERAAKIAGVGVAA